MHSLMTNSYIIHQLSSVRFSTKQNLKCKSFRHFQELIKTESLQDHVQIIRVVFYEVKRLTLRYNMKKE